MVFEAWFTLADNMYLHIIYTLTYHYFFTVFPKGFHLLRTYMENTFDPILNSIQDVLSPSVTYQVNPIKNIQTAESDFVVEDVTSDSTVKVAMHWMSSDFPTEETVTMTADHGCEIRKYKLIFQYGHSKLIKHQV